MADVPSTPADGNVATWLVPTIADPSAPTVAEIEAGVDISCYLTTDGFSLTVDQATITDERECSKEVYGKPGSKTWSLTLTGIDNTNSSNEATHNEFVDAMVEGTPQFVVRRRGVEFDTAVTATTQKVTVIPIEAGVKQFVPHERNSVIRSTYTAFVTAEVRLEVPVAAA
jgi:hypothetical protein